MVSYSLPTLSLGDNELKHFLKMAAKQPSCHITYCCRPSENCPVAIFGASLGWDELKNCKG